ncbi:MAG: glycosyltransferase family 4 protein [Aggregatilineales bacterium]
MPTDTGPTTTSNKRRPVVAIDYTPAYEQGGGIGRYVRELVAALADVDQQTPYRLFVAGARGAALPPPPAHNFTWRSTLLTPRWLIRIWHRLQLPLSIEVFTGSVALYHATDFVLPPIRKRTKTLLTVHDLSFVRVPETAPPRLKAYLDTVVPLSAQRADHILADSEATRQDLIDLYRLPPEKITVLLSGVDERFKPMDTDTIVQVRDKYGISDVDFLLSVGTVQPRKNYVRLIQALGVLRKRGHDLHLVVVGGKGWLQDPIYEAMDKFSLQPYTHFVGFADDADLPALYSAARCFVLPSLYEGFGLPVLEAMACGAPVVTSSVSSLPEVAGDAALLADPLDVSSIADTVERVLTDNDLRDNLVRAGLARAAEFTWERAARKLHEIYCRLLDQPSG